MSEGRPTSKQNTIVEAVLAIAILALATACATETANPPQSATAVQTDESGDIREIESLQDTYFQAVSEMNLDLLLTIWDDTDDVSVVTPLSRLQSLEELEGFFQGMNDAYLEVAVQRSNVSIWTEGTAAWSAIDFAIDAVTTDGQPLQFSGWETQTYRKTENGWRIAHVHYSVQPEQATEQ
jgi:ketosteroid isomerase-like protein